MSGKSKSKLPESQALRRYTSVPVMLDMFANMRISLCGVDSWIDENDRHGIQNFQRISEHTFIGVCCMAQAAETIHHWQTYSAGISGVCVIFNWHEFINHFSGRQRFKTGAVVYRTLEQIGGMGANRVNQLPFLKRKGFEAEKEFRMIAWSEDESTKIIDAPIERKLVDRVVVSPFVPPNLVSGIREAIHGLSGWEDLIVRQSNLINNMEFKNSLDRIAGLN